MGNSDKHGEHRSKQKQKRHEHGTREESSMTTERAPAVSGENEDDGALAYYKDEDELEAFPDAELDCEDGGRRLPVLLRTVTYS